MQIVSFVIGIIGLILLVGGPFLIENGGEASGGLSMIFGGLLIVLAVVLF